MSQAVFFTIKGETTAGKSIVGRLIECYAKKRGWTYYRKVFCSEETYRKAYKRELKYLNENYFDVIVFEVTTELGSPLSIELKEDAAFSIISFFSNMFAIFFPNK